MQCNDSIVFFKIKHKLGTKSSPSFISRKCRYDTTYCSILYQSVFGLQLRNWMGSSCEGETAGTEQFILEMEQFIWPQNFQSWSDPFYISLTSHTCPKGVQFAALCCFGHRQKREVSVAAHRYIHYLSAPSKMPLNPTIWITYIQRLS